jgi:tetratricopeptide (TPR) repeat protein
MAMAAFTEALKVYSITEYPLGYAATYNNLGNAYSSLSEIQDKEGNVTKAIKAFEEALKVYTLGKYPVQFRMVTSNMEQAKRKIR